MTEAPRLLSGLRVVELADASGAYCGKLLADLGADVVKVEAPSGDASRDIGPFYGGVPDRERSLFFWHYNTGKRSVTLDLGGGGDRGHLDALLDGSDVLLVTGRPSELAEAGLDPHARSHRHRRLIVAAISPFGLDGPRREWKSCDTVAQAAGGMVYVNGHAGEPPLRSFGLQAYHLAALHAATGVLLALRARERSGRGQVVDVSLQESVVAGLEHVTARFFSAGEVAERQGTLHWGGAFRVGRCRDGLVLCSNTGDWTSLVEWLKADGTAADLLDPVWESFAYRREHAEHLFDVVDRWLAAHTVDEIVSGAQLRRLPFAPVRPIESLRDHPQLEARGFFAPVEHEDIGATFLYPGAPYRFSRAPWRIERRAPRVGEHSAEVLSQVSVIDGPLSRMGEGKGEGDSMDSPSTPTSGNSGTGVFDRPDPNPLPSGRGDRSERGALDGIRVLDFTWVVAGPAATRVLADHGADVIKVERPDTVAELNTRGGLRAALNRGKRSIVIDLTRREGLEIARSLAARCDVVIDNFSPRVMANWGLDPASLLRANPRLVAVGMSGFGADGPLRDHVSYGPTLQAISGHTAHMRHRGKEPAGWGFSFSDMASGATAALAVLLALRHRERTGMGQAVDLSQLEALAALSGHRLLAASLGLGAPPFGNRSQERAAAPHGIYRCRTGARERWCAICVFTEDEWRSFVGAIGAPDWARSERFASLAGRLAAEEELDVKVEEWTSSRTPEEVVELLETAGVAAGIVADAEDLSCDPQLRARRYFATVRTREGGSSTVDGPPARLSGTPGRVRVAAPLPGEHTEEILRTVLGLDDTAIDRLRAAGAVA